VSETRIADPQKLEDALDNWAEIATGWARRLELPDDVLAPQCFIWREGVPVRTVNLVGGDGGLIDRVFAEAILERDADFFAAVYMTQANVSPSPVDIETLNVTVGNRRRTRRRVFLVTRDDAGFIAELTCFALN